MHHCATLKKICFGKYNQVKLVSIDIWKEALIFGFGTNIIKWGKWLHQIRFNSPKDPNLNYLWQILSPKYLFWLHPVKWEHFYSFLDALDILWWNLSMNQSLIVGMVKQNFKSHQKWAKFRGQFNEVGGISDDVLLSRAYKTPPW